MLKTHDKDLCLNAKDNNKALKAIIKNEIKINDLDNKYKISPEFSNTGTQIPWQKIQGPQNAAFVNFTDGTIQWEKNLDDTCKSNSPIELISYLENETTHETSIKLAKRYGINPKRPMEHKTTVPFKNKDLASEMAKNTPALVDNEKASFDQLIPVSMPHGGACYYVAIYKTASGKAIHVPICQRLSDNRADITSITWGFCPENIPLAGLDMLEKYPKARVLLVDDIWLADKINNLNAGMRNGTPDFVAVAIWAGIDRIPNYNFAPLMGCDVTFLPTLDEKSIQAGIKLKEMLMDAECNSFEILMTPIRGENWDLDTCKATCGDESVRRAVAATNRNITFLADDIGTAWEFKRYKRFLTEEGVIEQTSSGNIKSVQICPRNRKTFCLRLRGKSHHG